MNGGEVIGPCGESCPGDCGWNPDDPNDPCAVPLLSGPEAQA